MTHSNITTGLDRDHGREAICVSSRGGEMAAAELAAGPVAAGDDYRLHVSGLLVT